MRREREYAINNFIRPIGVVDDESNQDVIELLNFILANEYILMTKTIGFHWNIKGSNFNSLHDFFKDQYTNLLEMMDEVAERIKILDGHPYGTAREMIENNMVASDKNEAYLSSRHMIEKLLHDHQTIQEIIRPKLSNNKLFEDDPGTKDFLAGILRKHEKMSWMLKSNLNC